MHGCRGETTGSVTKRVGSLVNNAKRLAKNKMSFYTKTNRLHKLIGSEKWQEVLEFVRVNPREASKQAGVYSMEPGFFDGKHDSRLLPIHYACALQPPPDVIAALSSIHLDGLASRESYFGRMPLHVACLKNISLQCIQELLRPYPMACLVQDRFGRLPLHYALSNGAPFEVVQELVDTSPMSARIKEKNGWLPLHVACHMGMSDSILLLLLDAYPNGAISRNRRGLPPKVPTELLKEHLDRHQLDPDALSSTDSSKSDDDQGHQRIDITRPFQPILQAYIA
eukprot:scaffold11763_cov78-Attheya_sp.AAC.1